MQTPETKTPETTTFEFKEPAPPQDMTLLPSDLPHVAACVAFAVDWIGCYNWRGHSLKRLAPLRSISRRLDVWLFALPDASREVGGILVQHETAGWLIFYPAKASGRAKARGVCRELAHLSLRACRDSPLLSVPKDRQWRVLDAARRRVAAMLVGG